jgi:hypothetical protein
MTTPITPANSYDDLLWHTRHSYRRVAYALNEGAELTSPQISELTGVSLTSVKNALAYFKQLNFIHVCRWDFPEDKPNSMFAVYVKGAGFNVPKPAPRYLNGYKAKKEAFTQQEQEGHPWQELAQRLVPKRTESETREVNWAFLNRMARTTEYKWIYSQ